MSEINERIATMRKLKGLKQSEMARRLKMKESTYSQMERQGKIDCERLLKICDIFKCSPLEILFDEFPEKEKSKAPAYEPNPLLRAAKMLMDSVPVPIDKPVIPIEEMGLVTPNEMRMLDVFRQAKPKDKIEILKFAFSKTEISK